MAMLDVVSCCFIIILAGAAGAGLVTLGWWLAVITMKTEYVPIPFSESKEMKKARKGRAEKATVANVESYDDVLDDRGEL